MVATERQSWAGITGTMMIELVDEWVYGMTLREKLGMTSRLRA